MILEELRSIELHVLTLANKMQKVDLLCDSLPPYNCTLKHV